MSRIVRASWSPLGRHGSFGALGAPHPTLGSYVWVEWLRVGFERDQWSGGRPAEGYYDRRHLIEIGTAFTDGSPLTTTTGNSGKQNP